MLLLNNYNVEQILKTVSPTTSSIKYGNTLGEWLRIPPSLHSDPVASADVYIKLPYCSWRGIIIGLDFVDKASVADELISYSEPPAGV